MVKKKGVNMLSLLKRTVARLLLFGVPFALSYLATRPAQPVPAGPTFVVCADPTDRPGELRISLDPLGCAKEQGMGDGSPAAMTPAVRSTPERLGYPIIDKGVSVPF